MTFGQSLVKPPYHILRAHDGAYLDETSEQEHIENLASVCVHFYGAFEFRYCVVCVFIGQIY